MKRQVSDVAAARSRNPTYRTSRGAVIVDQQEPKEGDETTDAAEPVIPITRETTDSAASEVLDVPNNMSPSTTEEGDQPAEAATQAADPHEELNDTPSEPQDAVLDNNRIPVVKLICAVYKTTVYVYTTSTLLMSGSLIFRVPSQSCC